MLHTGGGWGDSPFHVKRFDSKLTLFSNTVLLQMALPYITSTEIPGKAVFQWDMPGPTLAKAQLLVALFFFSFWDKPVEGKSLMADFAYIRNKLVSVGIQWHKFDDIHNLSLLRKNAHMIMNL